MFYFLVVAPHICSDVTFPEGHETLRLIFLFQDGLKRLNLDVMDALGSLCQKVENKINSTVASQCAKALLLQPLLKNTDPQLQR